MEEYTSIEQQIAAHEGFEPRPYLCPAGRLSIGFGRNLNDKGISFMEARFLLRNDIDDAKKDCKRIFTNWQNYSKYRQWAFIDMRFNLGPSGFRSFRKMIAAANDEAWFRVVKEAINSRWYHQVGRRSRYIVELLKK